MKSGFRDPRRASERHPTEGMSCQLGDVLDLSAAGMRILCKGKPPIGAGQTSEFRLTFSGGTVVLTGQAMWRRKVARKKYEIGIRFLSLAPGMRKALDSLGRFGFWRAASRNASMSDARSEGTRVRCSVNVPDYYRVLNVSSTASAEQIKLAFRKLATTCHPDVADAPDAAERFARICEAYEVLKDAESRAMYDLRTAA